MKFALIKAISLYSHDMLDLSHLPLRFFLLFFFLVLLLPLLGGDLEDRLAAEVPFLLLLLDLHKFPVEHSRKDCSRF